MLQPHNILTTGLCVTNINKTKIFLNSKVELEYSRFLVSLYIPLRMKRVDNNANLIAETNCLNTIREIPVVKGERQGMSHFLKVLFINFVKAKQCWYAGKHAAQAPYLSSSENATYNARRSKGCIGNSLSIKKRGFLLVQLWTIHNHTSS